MEKSLTRVSGCFATALILIAGAASAQITNGSFESGDLTGWTVDMGAVEVIQPSNFSTSISTVDGSYYALLSTTPDRDGNGVDSGQDRDGVDGNEQDVAILSQTFNVSTVPNTLHFSVAMLTSEHYDASAADIVECRVDGNQVAHAGTSDNVTYTGTGFPFAGPFSGSYTVSSSGATDGSVFEQGVTVFHEITVPISTTGDHTLECYLGDGFSDGEVDSGLLIDNVYLEEGQTVPTLPSKGLALLGLLLLAGGSLAVKRT